MTGCHKKKVEPSITKQSIHNLKSSVFCGVKGFLTFGLAFLSYLEYGNYKEHSDNHKEHSNDKKIGTRNNSQKQACKLAYSVRTDGTTATQEIDTTINQATKEESTDQQHMLSKNNFTFIMKRNAIPFLEMVIIVPLVCFGLPTVIPNISLMQCALICAALMITTCFIVRTFNLREKLLEKTTDYTSEMIYKELNRDSIVYPIFDKDNKYVRYNSPDAEQLSINRSDFSYCSAIIIFPLKILQSCILLSLAAVEFLETIPSAFVDIFYNRSFESTKSNVQKSGHLLYSSVRYLISISKFDEPVAEFIGIPKVMCGC